MKKQILSTVLCIIMVLTIIPVFANETAPTTCNVLFEEDFEDGVSSLAIYDNTTQATDASGIYSIAAGSDYGQGTYALLLNNSDKHVQRTAFGVQQTGQLQNGSGGYTVEINFDWNPFVSGSANRINIVCNSTEAAAWNASNMSNTVSLLLTENETAQTLTVYNRASSNNIMLNEENLVTKIGAHVTDSDHVYRARVVMTAASATSTGATISVYLDDILMVEFVNGSSSKDRFICGLQFQHTGLTERGTIDNIKVLEYGTGVTGASSYLNDDALIAAIRRCEYELTALSEDKQMALAVAIQAAKTAYEDANRTQATVDAATAALEAAEEDAYKVYQYRTLHAENFEGTQPTLFVPYSGNADYNESTVATLNSANDPYYALDDKWYQLDVTEDENAGLVHEFATPSSGIGQNGINLTENIANNYKTELSFDYKMPKDITTYILINAINGEDTSAYTFNKSGKIFRMDMNPKTGVATLKNRADTVLATINLADYVLDTNFIEEVNRFRFVFEPETMETIDNVKYAGTVSLYINGIKAHEGKYIYNKKECAIGGLTVKCPTGDTGMPLGYIDNIELIDYDDTTLAVANAVPYVNRDRLVAAKRGGWSAYVSEEGSTSVTVKAIDAIAAGKAIVACYNANGMVAASMEDVTSVAADGTQTITIPSGYTGLVKVFLWDTSYNALMKCAELTIE